MELPQVWQRWGLEIRLSDDLAVARSVLAELGDWIGRRPVRVADFLPTGYAAYARILHPAYWHSTPTRWRDLARVRGLEVDAETSFAEASGIEPRDRRAWDEAAPQVGSLGALPLRVVGDVMASHTATPDRCVYLMWDGWGFWGGGVSYTIGAGMTAEQERMVRERAVEKAEAERAMLAEVPLVGRPGRNYYVFEGPLTAIGSSFQFAWYQSPSMWWPADRAWCVATEVDGDSTYIAGSRGCIDAILDASELEAIEVAERSSFSP